MDNWSLYFDCDNRVLCMGESLGLYSVGKEAVVVFLARKRNVSELLRKVVVLLRH